MPVPEPEPIPEPEPEPISEPEYEPAPTPDPEPESKPEPEPEPMPVPEPESEQEPESQTVVQPTPKQEPAHENLCNNTENDDFDEEQVYILPHRQRSFSSSLVAATIALIIGIAIGAVAAYFGHEKIVSAFSENQARPAVSKATAPEAPESKTSPVQKQTEPAAQAPEDKDIADDTPKNAEPAKKAPVYDYIGTRNYLTTMAGKHYGEKEFWVYIYDANASQLRHPDQIKPGTRILIPDKSTLPLTGDHKADVAAAKRHGVNIYARFK